MSEKKKREHFILFIFLSQFYCALYFFFCVFWKAVSISYLLCKFKNTHTYKWHSAVCGRISATIITLPFFECVKFYSEHVVCCFLKCVLCIEQRQPLHMDWTKRKARKTSLCLTSVAERLMSHC